MGFRNLLYRIDFSNNRIANFAFEKLGQELQVFFSLIGNISPFHRKKHTTGF